MMKWERSMKSRLAHFDVRATMISYVIWWMRVGLKP